MSTGRHLLKVLNHTQYKTKQTSPTLISSYKVRWVHKQKICEAWFVRNKITQLFGAKAAREAVQNQREEMQKPALSQSTLKLSRTNSDHFHSREGYSISLRGGEASEHGAEQGSVEGAGAVDGVMFNERDVPCDE